MAHRRYLKKLPIQGNVYPITTMAYFEDDITRFTFLTAHSVGVTSLQPGTFLLIMEILLQIDW